VQIEEPAGIPENEIMDMLVWVRCTESRARSTAEL
jgi:hypothetical protein